MRITVFRWTGFHVDKLQSIVLSEDGSLSYCL